MKKVGPIVSIVIVNWNGGIVFEECLKSLKKIFYKNFELIVVDNGSSDGSIEATKKYFKNAKIIRNAKNLGFAVANNQGYKKASGKYVLFLNNDTLVERDFLSKLVAKMENDPGVGVIQPKIKMMDSPKYLDNAGSFLTRTGFLQHWGFGELDTAEFSKEREIFSAKGAAMLVRSEVVNKIGLFDSDFFSYFEESDFCWRVWLTGWRVLYFPGGAIFHKVGFTSKKLSQNSVNYHSNKNRIHSLFVNLGNINLLLVFVPHLVIVLILGFFYSIKFKLGMAWMFYGAIWWNLKNFKKLFRKRRKVQRMRTVPDSAIFGRVGTRFDVADALRHFMRIEKNFE